MISQNEIDKYHQELLTKGIFSPSIGTIWMQHNGTGTGDYPWKMHIYADSYTDWYNLAKIIIPYLVSEGATFKTIDNSETAISWILQNNEIDQFGKAFTIYPSSQQEFEKLALGINNVLTKAGLNTKPHLDTELNNMSFERQLGKTGRIFYRLERDAQGNYVSAYNAKQINPTNPYNPFNLPDPFKHLFDEENTYNTKPQQQSKEIFNQNQIISTILKLVTIENIKYSSDTSKSSQYLYPKDVTQWKNIELLLQQSGLQYDIHYSNLYNKYVFRVFGNHFITKNYIFQKGIALLKQIEQANGVIHDIKNMPDKKYIHSKNPEQIENILKGQNIPYEKKYNSLIGHYVFVLSQHYLQ